jgi:anti-sigma factor RsiW
MNTCDDIRKQLPMLLYGELCFDDEERVEKHLEDCAACRTSLERERELLAAFDQVAVEPSPTLLHQSRQKLFAQLQSESAPARAAGNSWWDRLIEAFTIPAGILRPAGALTFVALGFLGARLAPSMGPLSGLSMADINPGSSRVRAVEASPNGQVRIVLDETRQRTVSGSLEKNEIRALLLAATRDPNDPRLRASTVAILGDQTDPNMASDIRDTLVFAILNDQNDGVRLKAIAGLKTFTMEPDVRNALAEVLLADANPAMRNQAIDLLMQGLDGSAQQTMDRRVIGILQELMSREAPGTYVRQQSRKALQLVNASSEIY